MRKNKWHNRDHPEFRALHREAERRCVEKKATQASRRQAAANFLRECMDRAWRINGSDQTV